MPGGPRSPRGRAGPLLAAIIAWLILAPASGTAAVPTDEAGFTAYVAGLLQRSLPHATVTASAPLTLMLRQAGTAAQLRLESPLRFCRAQPADCERSLQAWMQGIVASLGEAAAPVRPEQVRAVVRASRYVDDLRQQTAGAPGGSPIVRPLAGDLWVICVADRPRGVKMLSGKDLAALGLTEDQAFALARRNLSATLPALTAVARALPDDGIGIIDRDFYAPSRVLLHDDWGPLAHQLHDRLLVALPATDTLLYVEDRGAIAVEALRRLARELAQRAERPLSPTLLRWTPSGWEAVGP